MKTGFVKFILLACLLVVAFHLANGADVKHLGQCDTDLECNTMPCAGGDGYCDHKDGKCKCPKLRCYGNPECEGLRCNKGRAYCANGACMCPKLQAVETKKHTNGAEVTHLGHCDTDLECYTMRCDRGNGYCDHSKVDGVCRCPK